MKITKKVLLSGNWAKVGEDIIDNGTITIQDEGKEVDGDYGKKRTVFSIKTTNGDKIMTFNQTSLNNLVDAYGDDSNQWINQMARTYIVKQKIGGKLKNIAYICGLNWVMLEDGSFVQSKDKNAPQTNSSPLGAEYDDIPIPEHE